MRLLPAAIASALFLSSVFSSSPVAAQSPPTAEPVASHDALRPRLGLGLTVGGGVAQGDPSFAAVTALLPLGIDLRAGAQIDRSWALYYQGAAVLAMTFGCHGDECGVFPAAYHLSSVMAELTIDDGIGIAFGPSLAWGLLAPRTGWGGGATARIGWTFGGRGPGTREGLSLAVESSVFYLEPKAGGLAGTLSITIGWDMF